MCSNTNWTGPTLWGHLESSNSLFFLHTRILLGSINDFNDHCSSFEGPIVHFILIRHSHCFFLIDIEAFGFFNRNLGSTGLQELCGGRSHVIVIIHEEERLWTIRQEKLLQKVLLTDFKNERQSLLKHLIYLFFAKYRTATHQGNRRKMSLKENKRLTLLTFNEGSLHREWNEDGRLKSKKINFERWSRKLPAHLSSNTNWY